MEIEYSPIIHKGVEKEIDPAFRRRALIILKEVSGNKKARILDVGCGRGFYTNTIGRAFPLTRIWGVDRSEKYLALARVKSPKNTTYVNSDAQKLPFGNYSFDVILCSELLEHVPNDKKILMEINRVAKKGARVIFSVPHSNYPFFWDPLNWVLEKIFRKHIPSDIWWLAGIWADHIRLYSESELVTKVGMCGFKITQIYRSTRWALPLSHFLLYGIGKNLVENGLVPGADRFDYETRQGWGTSIIKWIFRSWDRLNDVFPPRADRPFLNIILIAEKK